MLPGGRWRKDWNLKSAGNLGMVPKIGERNLAQHGIHDYIYTYVYHIYL